MLLPPDPPETNPTVPISRDEVQLGLLNKLVGSVQDLKDGMGEIRADLGLVANDLGVVKDRISLVEKRSDDLERRADSNSVRARGQSQADLEGQAALGQERAAREALATKVDGLAAEAEANKQSMAVQTAILSRLDKVTQNPTVKLVLHALAMGFVAWLAAKGIHVGSP
jgi:hypothetical protein